MACEVAVLLPLCRGGYSHPCSFVCWVVGWSQMLMSEFQRNLVKDGSQPRIDPVNL